MRRIVMLFCVVGLFVIGLRVAQGQASVQVPVETLVPEVLNVYPHDTTAFTQGLIYYEGTLYESTGLRGQSTLRQVEIGSGEVLRSVPLMRPSEQLTGDNPLPDYFGEGLERIDDRLIQLTWTAGEAFVYDLDTFERVDTYTYEGQGWGLCYDGRYLFMSDSTQYLSVRDPETFDLIVRFLVTLEGRPINANFLNELECVGDHIYANMWNTDVIVRIDKFTGIITAVIDASNLLTEAERAELNSSQVLNGIAYNPDSDTFYITGKQWPKLFEVRFVPAEGGEQ